MSQITLKMLQQYIGMAFSKIKPTSTTGRLPLPSVVYRLVNPLYTISRSENFLELLGGNSTQYTDGITGALIVYPSDPAPRGFPTWDQDLVVQVNDLYHTFSSVLLAAYLSPFGIDGTPGDEPVADGGTLNGLGQWGGTGNYFNFTVEPNKTYRIRLINTGSFASIRFSIDNHPLTIIEADGTLVKPYNVSGLTIAVAQRYSVLIRTNGTRKDGTYWMRSQVQTDMFTYDVPGQNTDIRGVLRYSNAQNAPALPTATDDPGPGKKLADMDDSLLIPAVIDTPPNNTRRYPITVALENTNDGRFLAFINRTSWEPLTGTSTLLAVHNAGGSSYAPNGGSLQDSSQFLITENSIQTVDLLINNLDDGDHPFHLHGHRPWIMGTGSGRYIGQPLNTKSPLRRDTVLIPAYSWMILRFITDNHLSKLAYGLSTVISHGIWPLVYSCRSTVYPPLPPTSRFLSLLYTNVARNRHCWCNPIHIQAVSRCTRDFCPWRSGLR
ncbi:unnamed protein product [Somion occarium]|uniref:laccase n=1 Tax=Somion occarium TaxID=3059160 RepID=A0ABP1CPA2_9APHY